MQQAPKGLGVRVVHHMEPRKVLPLFIAALIPERPQQCVAQGDGAEPRPPDAEDDDIMEPLTEAIGQLPHLGDGVGGVGEVEEAHVTRGTAGLDGPVRSPEAVRQLLVQSLGPNPARRMRRQEVREVETQ